VWDGVVMTNGAILEIGPISSQTLAASINQAVKKSGRTTGLTHSFIDGLNPVHGVRTRADICKRGQRCYATMLCNSRRLPVLRWKR